MSKERVSKERSPVALARELIERSVTLEESVKAEAQRLRSRNGLVSFQNTKGESEAVGSLYTRAVSLGQSLNYARGKIAPIAIKQSGAKLSALEGALLVTQHSKITSIAKEIEHIKSFRPNLD
jgi:hypothetical protein